METGTSNSAHTIIAKSPYSSEIKDFIRLIFFYMKKNGSCYASQYHFSVTLGKSVRHIRRWIRILREDRVLDVKRIGFNRQNICVLNLYKLDELGKNLRQKCPITQDKNVLSHRTKMSYHTGQKCPNSSIRVSKKRDSKTITTTSPPATELEMKNSKTAKTPLSLTKEESQKVGQIVRDWNQLSNTYPALRKQSINRLQRFEEGKIKLEQLPLPYPYIIDFVQNNEDWQEQWDEVKNAIRTNTFLQTGAEYFKTNLEWLFGTGEIKGIQGMMKFRGVQQILSGKYPPNCAPVQFFIDPDNRDADGTFKEDAIQESKTKAIKQGWRVI
jgi:hypothetical protein